MNKTDLYKKEKAEFMKWFEEFKRIMEEHQDVKLS
nr:MAG TPA: hypothetical protein [Caudoviricetes sp.]